MGAPSLPNRCSSWPAARTGSECADHPVLPRSVLVRRVRTAGWRWLRAAFRESRRGSVRAEPCSGLPRAGRPGSTVCPDGQRASYLESPGRRAGSAGAGLLALLQRAGRLPAGRLVHHLRPAAAGVQADSLCHEPGVDHRRGVHALLAVRSPALRGRRPVRPQASHAGQRHRPGARDRRDPRPGDRRAAAGHGHLCRDLRAVDARNHLRLRGVRGHPRARRRAGTGHGQRPHHGSKQRRSDPRPRARRRARGFRACSRPPVRGRRLLSPLVGLPGPDPLQLQRRHAGQAPRRLTDPGPAPRRAGGPGLRVVQPGTALHLDHDGPDQPCRHDGQLPSRPLCPTRPARHQLRDRLPVCRWRRRHRRGQSRLPGRSASVPPSPSPPSAPSSLPG